MNILILTEGSTKLGFGHIYRMSSIYDYLSEQGHNCKFIVNSDKNAEKILQDKNYELLNWLENVNIHKLLEKFDIVFVDSYLADYDILEKISKNIELPIYFDDNNRIDYPSGIVVNFGIYAEELNYKENRKNDYLLGSKYTLLRKPFREKSNFVLKKEIKSIFISLGGSDFSDLILKIFKILVEKFPNISYNVVIGNINSNYLEDKLKIYKNINLYKAISAQKMKEIMENSDVAISASGQTLYELTAIGVPTIAICVVENQRKNYEYFGKFKIVEKAKNVSEITEKIDKLSYDKRKSLSEEGKKIINKNGIENLLNKIKLIKAGKQGNNTYREDSMNIEQEVERQMEILKRGVEEIISEDEMRKRLKESIENNKPLRIKLGIDPTGSDLHIGHAVPLRKLKQFQELGHKVVFLIGTFTAKIGDPTGKNETRKMMTSEEIERNLKTYLEQVKFILDLEKTEVVYNGDWLEKLSLEQVLGLLSQFTVSQMISREDFSKRLKENKPVSLVEFMYPILQGYDSVAINADIELGATEQKFNLLRGRDLQTSAGQKPQICMMMPILEGLDGVNKMSKSLNNYIGITDKPNDMFGKVMSISDELMFRYYTYATEIPVEEIELLKNDVKNDKIHPMEAKKRLAEEVIKLYYNENIAKEAREHFEIRFSKKEIPDDLPEHHISIREIGIIELLAEELKFFKSKSEARRLIKQGGFKINDIQEKDINKVLKIEDGMIIRAGKKKMVKLKKST